ncbi:UvrD-helicase domain-containing protein [Candidatus Cardinium hertigii]|uniref:DNA 3'-5' helicase n=1 Tax=Candidatus Cardinium hertigii TaxID=247481 RepID=A0A3N2QAW2_9BACT|nr:UvrD-helicase domain-containing protein [Candidatus Cardinium hertigii]ROT46936.1 hypothetical protein EDM02_05150 [Candidatus Cardinium hertigii]
MAQLLIYRASAGSGKTHTLVTRYIKWALRYPSAFKHILAITFTHRATQEMQQRIIAYLYSLSIGEETVLLIELCQTGWAKPQLQERSKEVLSMIVHRYGDFSVTTIDSFFHKIIQSFTKELGLKEHFSIEMDQALALQETVEELVASPCPLLQKWLVDFALAKLVAGKTWHVKNDIQQLGKALFEESFKLHEKALLATFQQKALLPQFIKSIQTFLLSFEQKMQKIGQVALNILQKEGLEPADFAYGTKGIIGYFFKIAHTKDFKPTKRAIIGSAHLEGWYNRKKNHQSTKITRVVTTLLYPLLMEAITLYEQEGLRYRTAAVMARFTYAFGMIGALLLGLEAYRSKHNVLFISDIAALLYQIIQENDTPFLYEKIGNQFHHFLIDEFQDLSLFQWINIKPLLHNSLAQGYTNILVGDVKQSIYRWRGSNWKLLNHYVEEEFKESSRHALTINRRSQETIVLFNNLFFSTASNQLTHYLEITLTSAIPSLPIAPLQYELAQMRRAYGDVAQQAVMDMPRPNRGYVECLFLRSNPIDQEEDTFDWKACAQKEVIKLLAQMQQEGIQAKDIVLLVRNNSEAALITHVFNNPSKDNQTSCPYALLSDYSHSLWSHIAIKVLIRSLYYLNNTDDLINKVAWIEAYYSCIEKGPVAWHHYALEDVTAVNPIEDLIHSSFWAQKDFLKNLSIYTCVNLLIEILFTKSHAYSDILSFFQSIVLDFSYKETASIEAFLIWWEKRGKNIQLPANNHANAIRVMTIHQAKGLECKVVIMPFCSWHLDHGPQHGPTLWSTSHQPSPGFPVWPLGYGADLKETYYANDYHLERMQIHLDNLNLLYVAFTRAQERLYVMAPFPETTETMTTTADLVYQSLLKHTSHNAQATQNLVTDMQEIPTGTKFCFGKVTK